MSGIREKVKRKQYDAQQLVAAVQAVKDGMKVCEAARKYEVPWTTLGDHVRNKTKEGAKVGNKPIISEAEEVALVDYLKYMATRNMPLRRRDIRKIIVDIIRLSGMERVLACKFNLYKGPSDVWFTAFEKRHPEVQWAFPETLHRRKDIDQFFDLYESLIEELDLKDKPQQIFNYDECWGDEQVSTIVETYQRRTANSSPITVMMTASASGTVLPTMLIYKDCFPDNSDEMPPSWHRAISQDGYISKDFFLQWFRDVFLPNCGSQRPVLLVLDDHESHTSPDFMVLANKNQVEILMFPSHTSHILQPMDVGIFGSLKKKYKQLCVKAGFGYDDYELRKAEFATMWQTCVKEAATLGVVQSAFCRTGLHPFNPNIIDDTKARSKYATVITKPGEPPSPKMAKITVPKSEPCTKCGRYPHPVESVRTLPPEIELAFPVPQTDEISEVPVKRTKRLKTDS